MALPRFEMAVYSEATVVKSISSSRIMKRQLLR